MHGSTRGQKFLSLVKRMPAVPSACVSKTPGKSGGPPFGAKSIVIFLSSVEIVAGKTYSAGSPRPPPPETVASRCSRSEFAKSQRVERASRGQSCFSRSVRRRSRQRDVDGKGNVVEDGPVDYNAVGHRL